MIISEWKKSLGYLTTHHMISNHLIEINGQQATVKAYFHATHCLHNPYGDDNWTLVANMTLHFSRTAVHGRFQT